MTQREFSGSENNPLAALLDIIMPDSDNPEDMKQGQKNGGSSNHHHIITGVDPHGYKVSSLNTGAPRAPEIYEYLQNRLK